MYDLTVILPTLNEEESIEGTINTIDKILKNSNINGEILVVDDNSSLDNTIFILFELERKYPNLTVVIRQSDHGLSQSLVEGFNKANSDIMLVTDADGQHQLDKIPDLYHIILDGNDIAIGSRYMDGGKIEGWSAFRKLLSWGATYLARFFFPNITDSGSGFFAIRKAVIKDAPLKPQGFRMLFEILGKGYWKTFKETPYTFGIRKKGMSKLKTQTIILYLKQLWGLLKYSLAHTDSHGHAEIKRGITFVCVGLTGVIVNLTTLYILTEWLNLIYVISGILGVEVSILSNFMFHEEFTFKDILPRKQSWVARFITYHVTSFLGAGINTLTLIILTMFVGWWYMVSAAIGIMLAFIWNFATNRGIVWEGERRPIMEQEGI